MNLKSLWNWWKFNKNKGELSYDNLDKKLELKKSLELPTLESNQVALYFAKVRSGQIVNTQLELYVGQGEIYHVYDSMEQAKEIGRKIIKENDLLECWITYGKDKASYHIYSGGEEMFDAK